ncbi:non-classical arabinogalactan protein 31-like [Gastrolobium bilobum]|uniref:non-classical arabinogalactan protein 31-like n=1 Tax=Gastrolobium bilobum TaxID=150636 RepID=UPI002AAFD8CF|nr:non-classical arabinogalactan protein 31-like [Gastrolobium bilobum]
MAKALAFFILLVSSFNVFAQELDSLPHPPLHPPVAAPPYYHHPKPPSTTPAPVHPPTHPPAHPPHHNHHHHHHPPAPTPAPVKPPVHPPTPAPAKPPTHHYTPPTHAPVKPPTHPHYPPAPVHPPAHPPVHPFPRSFVAVEGVVFNKSCKYAGLDTLLGATPVLGAVVKLECNNTRYPLVQTVKTDKNGYFYLQAPKSITTFGAHKCKVFLVTSPTGLKPSNFHDGVTGALLKPEKPFVYHKLPFLLYSVGPLAFEPQCPH